MLASTRGTYRRGTRRGVILILVLGMLALMAVIGVTFATFSGQARIGSRIFAQSVNQPQRDELMDFALAQLISDTADVRSAIRGHSLARDMYGNDARFNGYLTGRPGGVGPTPFNYSIFYITNITRDPNPTHPPTWYILTTNIPQNDPALYGFDFTRWTLRVQYNGAFNPGVTGVINQSLEVIIDNGYNAANATPRLLTVNINPQDANAALVNPTATTNTQLPGLYLVQAATNNTPLLTSAPFILDGRWLHAFNGPGMTTNAVHGNFRYNQPFVAGPFASGMDEDYDAADLENWFLAMQSADGSVMIPSFHRPGILRYEYTAANAVVIDDWKRLADTTVPALANWTWFDSASRILRPVAADGHDPTTFPDLRPDATGKIKYDVDNDGDGITDSVWVDLGYPARRNAQGQFYKPLFAFMVIGLNGRIPLNTAGNLAGSRGIGTGVRHAEHLGSSVSEIDPTYGLQNGFAGGTTNDGAYAFTTPVFDPTTNTINYAGFNSQVDSAGMDVRLTQLRNLLAGTRPHVNPQPTGSQLLAGGALTSVLFPMVTDPPGPNQQNGDDNFVAYNSGQIYFMPNGVAEAFPVDQPSASYAPNVVRMTHPVPGRWGEAQSVHGYPIPSISGGPPVNLVTPMYNSRVRAGYSIDPGDLYYGPVRDAADDNYNTFDPAPPVPVGTTRGEVGDFDLYDPAGALVLPVERWRRFLTPADINGTGRVLRWSTGLYPTPLPPTLDSGADQWGRVVYYSYFRPPGLPGQINTTSGAILFPWATSDPYPATIVANTAGNLLQNNNNPLHGFESFRFPNLQYPPPASPPAFSPQRVGGTPIDGPPFPPTQPYPILPSTLPTYDAAVNAHLASDGLNEADEMNLYQPNPQLDAPFSFSDLEWLYRKQDVDGASLTSRLAQLAPISFTNTVDGQRRRRLYALDSWETNSYAWASDNPGNAFPNNSRFGSNTDASYHNWASPPAIVTPPGLAAPALAHRDKKINLNYPLPVSNDPNEPIRQKWITDAYLALKAILPPKAVDTPEELAQLSQYVINIIDFRDPDSTMTHWINPDVWFRPGLAGTNPVLVLTANKAVTDLPLSQYGMEYNPVAINEVLAYSFARKVAGAPTSTPRFFIELVNTLTRPKTGVVGNNPSILDLAGFQSVGAATPWDGGAWDVLFTADDPASRPDPFTGQLWYGGTFYGLFPLAQGSFTGATSDPLLAPLPPFPATTGSNPFLENPPPPAPITNLLTIGNPLADATSESLPFPPTFTLSTTYDPFSTTHPAPPPIGVLPASATVTQPPYPGGLSIPVQGTGTVQYYWVCLRRPANPFAPVSAANPMIVVDCMRFPLIESGGTGQTTGAGDSVQKGGTAPGYIFSYQRLQPYRGGQAVPLTGVAGALDPRYGYTEQIAVPTTAYTVGGQFDYGQYGTTATQDPNPPAPWVRGPQVHTNPIRHTLGAPNDGTLPTGATSPFYEPWDQFVFNDRDFSSVAELMLVPGCPPGLFTKQFAEFAPSTATLTGATSIFPRVVPPPSSSTYGFGGDPLPASYSTATTPFIQPLGAAAPVIPHTFPYLVDKFFYTGASPATAASVLFGDSSGDGWFKMLEFFEVPSQMIGAIGPVSQGMNFDWARQDAKPGLINLNLVIDEEVFFSVFGKQDGNFGQQLLNFDQLPPIRDNLGNFWLGGAWGGPATLLTGSSPLPLVVSEVNSVGSPTWVYPMPNVGVVAPDPLSAGAVDNRMKAAFAQFLSLRHGGSGFVFGHGSGAVGQNFTLPTNPPNPNAPAAPFGIPADRPFHSLSYPDINYTVMRPAALPPSANTDPQLPATPPTPTWPPAYTGNYVGDPGVRNPSLYQGYVPGVSATPLGTTPRSLPASQIQVPPAIPVRRLFQPPDANGSSNAYEQADAYVVKTTPVTAGSNTGALPTFLVPPPPAVGGTATDVTNKTANIIAAGVGTGAPNAHIGANGTTPPDARQNPYFRSEMMQKALNLTTVRTHQYAVWITVGFFEVKRQGDLGILAFDPRFAFDILGPEVGAATGQANRYRAFFVVDRLQLTGFDPNTPGSFRPAVMYRQDIE
jgi:hypothetical protein